MTKAKQKANEEPISKIVLPACLEITGIREFYNQVKAMVKNLDKTVVVDAGDVSVADTAGIQLVISLIRTIQDKGSEVSWDNYSIQLHMAAAEIGLDKTLDELIAE